MKKIWGTKTQRTGEFYLSECLDFMEEKKTTKKKKKHRSSTSENG